MSADRYFLDTNIFVTALLPSETAKAARATALVREAGLLGDGVTSLQVVQEFLSVGLRKFRTCLQADDAAHYVRHVFPPLVRVGASLDLYAAGLALTTRYQLSLPDALIVAAAIEANCRILYSEDFQNGRQFDRLRVVNPFRAA